MFSLANRNCGLVIANYLTAVETEMFIEPARKVYKRLEALRHEGDHEVRRLGVSNESKSSLSKYPYLTLPQNAEARALHELQ